MKYRRISQKIRINIKSNVTNASWSERRKFRLERPTDSGREEGGGRRDVTRRSRLVTCLDSEGLSLMLPYFVKKKGPVALINNRNSIIIILIIIIRVKSSKRLVYAQSQIRSLFCKVGRRWMIQPVSWACWSCWRCRPVWLRRICWRASTVGTKERQPRSSDPRRTMSIPG